MATTFNNDDEVKRRSRARNTRISARAWKTHPSFFRRYTFTGCRHHFSAESDGSRENCGTQSNLYRPAPNPMVNLFSSEQLAIVTLLVASFGTAQAQTPAPGADHCKKGLALYHKGDFRAAEEQFELALKLDPNNASARKGLGAALASTGNMNLAIAQFEETLRLNSNSAEAHYDLGVALYWAGNLDSAIRQFKAALDLNPGIVQAYTHLGLAYGRQGNSRGSGCIPVRPKTFPEGYAGSVRIGVGNGGPRRLQGNRFERCERFSLIIRILRRPIIIWHSHLPTEERSKRMAGSCGRLCITGLGTHRRISS